MNSEENKTAPEAKTEANPIYDDPILQACYNAGYLGFDKQYLIIALGLSEKVIRDQFRLEEGNYNSGFS
jgi:hypothetical protein